MRDKTYKILNLIAKYISQSEDKSIHEEDIVNELMEMNFEMNEIDTALFWIETMGLNIEQTIYDMPVYSYMRIMTREEENSLTRESINYLYFLKEKGLIDNDMFEDILEKVVVANSDRKLGINEIKLLTALTAFNNNKKLFNYVLDNESEVIYN